MNENDFILSDQSINCYGFIILTNGIILDDFRKNPVMLYSHDAEKLDNLIGRWENTRVEGVQLIATANIDTEDDFAKKVAGKVKRGYLKGCSCRFDFNMEDITLDMFGYEGIPVITKCVLKEASLCSVPGNSNAIKLFNNGEEIKDASLSLSLSANKKQQTEINQMKEIIAILAASGITLSANASAEHVAEGLNTLILKKKEAEDKVTTLTAELSAANQKLADKNTADVNAFLDQAAKDGKITAEQKPHYQKLALADFESTKEIVNALPQRGSISALLNNNGGGNTEDKYKGWTFKDFQKKDSVELARIRKDEPERYKALYEAQYPQAKK